MGSKNKQYIHEVGEFIQFNGTKRANSKTRKTKQIDSTLRVN